MSSCPRICQILYYPNPNLRLKAELVTKFDSPLNQFIDEMFETMYKHQGIGLAAIQVNVQEQIVVMDLALDKKNQLVFINPVITEKKGEATGMEGCLSIPGIFEKVKRAASVHVKALDRNGKEFELDAEGLLSACIQHEVDHLHGVLFIDHLSRLKQQLVFRKIKKLQKERM